MWLSLAFLCGSLLLARAEPVKICVLEAVADSCRQMASDLPDSYQCVVAADELGCLRKVHAGEADVVNAEPRGIFLGGKHLHLAPVVSELVDGAPYLYQGVAVVSKNSDVQSAADLRGRPSCHTGVGRTVGWDLPLGRLMAAGLARTAGCDDSELDVAEAFFGSACAPGNWSQQAVVQEELRRRHPALCSACKDPATCSGSDAYAGYEGALRCLSEGSGEVAFTKVPALRDYLARQPDLASRADLLCFDGGRRALDDPEPCAWGERPTNAFLVSSALPEGERDRISSVLLDTQTRHGVPQVSTPDWYHKSFLSSAKATALQAVGPQRNTYQTYLGNFVHAISKPRPGCERSASFCVTSEAQVSQASDLRLASEARGLWPLVSYLRAPSLEACMQSVRDGKAHMVVLDGGDVYKAGRRYGLDPVASELYDGSDASYYAVAVVSKDLEGVKALADLRGLRSCHTGLGKTAGWVMPVGALLAAHQLGEGCDRAAAVAEFFSGGSCAPGANDTRYNPELSGSRNLCKQCVGDEQGNHVCSRGPEERYGGYAGAFRCLAEGAGDVAFVKHSTVTEHADGRGTEAWDRYLASADFRLLCGDEGGTAAVDAHLDCNLGKVPAHHVMTAGGFSREQRLRLSKLTGELSRHFGPASDLYRLFRGARGRRADRLFDESAGGLRATPLDATYDKVLGEKFLAASRATDPEECQSAR